MTTISLLINLDVPDLPRAEAFYCEAFGFTVGRRFGESVVELIGASAPLYLLAKDECSRDRLAPDAVRHYARHWTPLHLDVVVDDLDAAITRAVSAGAVAEGGIREAAWGRIAQFSDPFGHGICLLQFLNRGYDEIAR